MKDDAAATGHHGMELGYNTTVGAASLEVGYGRTGRFAQMKLVERIVPNDIEIEMILFSKIRHFQFS